MDISRQAMLEAFESYADTKQGLLSLLASINDFEATVREDERVIIATRRERDRMVWHDADYGAPF